MIDTADRDMIDGIGGTDGARIDDATLDAIRNQAKQLHANGHVAMANGLLLQIAILDELRTMVGQLQEIVYYQRIGS